MYLTVEEIEEQEPENEFTDIEPTNSVEPATEQETTEEETTAPVEITKEETKAPETTQAETEATEPEMEYLSYDAYKASIGNGYSFGENSDSGYYLWVIEAHNMATTNALIYLDISYEDRVTENGFALELY